MMLASSTKPKRGDQKTQEKRMKRKRKIQTQTKRKKKREMKKVGEL